MKHRKASLLTAAVVAAALTIAPGVAPAHSPDLGKPAGKATVEKMLKRFDLTVPKTSRGSAKRPHRNAQHVKPSRARFSVYYTGECAIYNVIDYLPNSTTLPYTWRQFQSNGAWYGYYVYSRYGFRTEWPSGYDKPSVRTCSWALGYQYEMYRWNGRQWIWESTVNCDVSNRCTEVR